MEVAVWKKRWQEVAPTRRQRIHLSLGVVGLLLLIPWPANVHSHGVAHAERQQLVFTPFPAMLEELHAAGKVESGVLLASFSTPDLSIRESQTQASIEALERRLAGLIDADTNGASQLPLTQRLEEQLAEIRGIHAEAGRLDIHAEFAGEWRDLPQQLRPGSWVGVRDSIGILIDPDSWVVDTYVEQRQIKRIQTGAQATFLAQGQVTVLAAEVIDIDTTRTQRVPHPMLDSRHGGTFTTHQDKQDTVFSDTLYRVRLRLTEPPSQIREMRGTVRIEGKHRSLLLDATMGVAAVLIRESGF
jgi:putative peptide zinc metalloprotease protein